jgi:hypothetical protein
LPGLQPLIPAQGDFAFVGDLLLRQMAITPASNAIGVKRQATNAGADPLIKGARSQTPPVYRFFEKKSLFHPLT